MLILSRNGKDILKEKAGSYFVKVQSADGSRYSRMDQISLCKIAFKKFYLSLLEYFDTDDPEGSACFLHVLCA